MSDPILPFEVWEEGTLQNDVPANDNSLRNEILNGLVISNATTAQPGSPADGDIYILAATHTGSQWAAFSQYDLVIYKGGTWYAYAPVEGIVVNLAGSLYSWNGSAYVSVGGGGGGSPGGSDTQVQFNDAGAFAGDAALTFNKTTKVLAQAGALNEAKGTNIASAATTDIGAATGTFVHVTGTTTITALGTVQAGTRRVVTFDGALILTHNATSLILPTGANITTAANDSAVFVSEGSGNWRCVSYQRANGQALASSGAGGLTNWTDALNTSSPNATVPVASLSATNAATNVDAAIVPKGTGALLGSIPDGTATGGNKRGASSTDLQRSRSAATQVASSSESVICGGAQNTSSGFRSFVGGGTGNTASGSGAAVPGGSGNTASAQYAFAVGNGCVADGDRSRAFGQQSTTRGAIGAEASSSGQISSLGDCQNRKFHLQAFTTNATVTAATADGSAAGTTNQVTLPNSSAFIVKATVMARQAATGDGASWEITAHVKRGASAAATSIVGTATVTPVGTDTGASTWVAAVAADTTNGSLRFNVTGEAAKTIKWGVHVYSCNEIA